MAIADDGSVYAAWKKPENRKMRKSKKLEFLTTLLDTMMSAIYEFSAKIKNLYQFELEKVSVQHNEEQDRMKRKIKKLKSALAEVEKVTDKNFE